VRGVLLTLRDVSERKQLERALTRQAFSDQLTGLPNRALIRDRTEQAIRLAGRQGLTAALLLLDLDRFKEVNDTLGHHHGDLLLQQVAERLRGTLRDSDTVARLGGDEFAVLLPQIASVHEAAAVADKLSAAIEAPFTVDGLTLDVDASIGVATYPDHATDANQLLQRADVAMYAARPPTLGTRSTTPPSTSTTRGGSACSASSAARSRPAS
jgi:diguanylate cyclase (GGDEF)-like protein